MKNEEEKTADNIMATAATIPNLYFHFRIIFNKSMFCIFFSGCSSFQWLCPKPHSIVLMDSYSYFKNVFSFEKSGIIRVLQGVFIKKGESREIYQFEGFKKWLNQLYFVPRLSR